MEILIVFARGNNYQKLEKFIPGEIYPKLKFLITSNVALKHAKNLVEIVIADFKGKNEIANFININLEIKNNDEAEELKGIMGTLPLAWMLMAEYIKKFDMKIGDCIKKYKRDYRYNKERISDLKPKHINLTIIIRMILNTLKMKKNPITDVIYLAAFLDAVTIPYSLVESILGMDSIEFRKQLNFFTDLSILENEEEKSILRQHRLVQRIIRESLRPIEKDEILSRMLPILLRKFPIYDMKSTDLKVIAPCVQMFATHAARFVLKKNGLSKFVNGVINLIDNLTSYLLYYSYYEQALTHLQNLLKLQEKGQRKQDLATTYDKLGRVKKEFGEFQEAIIHFQKAYDLKKDLLDEKLKDIEFAKTKIYLAETYLQKGENGKALQCAKDADDLLKKGMNPEGKLHAYAYRVLAQANLSLGYFNGAILYNERSRGINDKIKDDDSLLETAENYKLYGEIYLYGTDLEKSKKYFDDALKIYHGIYGNSHPKLADLYDYNGLFYSKSGSTSVGEAIHCHQQALFINREWFGSNHIYCAGNYASLGFTNYTLTEYSLSKRWYSDAESIFIKGKWSANDILLKIYIGLSKVCLVLAETADAIDYIKKAKLISEELGKKHNNKINLPCNAFFDWEQIWNTIQEKNKEKNSRILPEDLGKISVEIKEIFGDSHIEYAEIVYYKARCYQFKGDRDSAKTDFTAAKSICHRSQYPKASETNQQSIRRFLKELSISRASSEPVLNFPDSKSESDAVGQDLESAFNGLPNLINSISDRLKVIRLEHAINSYQIDCLKRYMNFLYTSNRDQIIHWFDLHTFIADVQQLSFLIGVQVSLNDESFRENVTKQLNKYESCFLVFSDISDFKLIDKYLDLSAINGTLIFVTDQSIEPLRYNVEIRNFEKLALPPAPQVKIKTNYPYEFLKTLEIFNTAYFPLKFVESYIKFLYEAKLLNVQVTFKDLYKDNLFGEIKLNNEVYIVKQVSLKNVDTRKHINYLRCALKAFHEVFIRPDHVHFSPLNSYYQSLGLWLFESKLVTGGLLTKELTFDDVVLLVRLSNRCARIYCWQGLWDIGLGQMKKSRDLLNSKDYIKNKTAKDINDEIEYLCLRMQVGAVNYQIERLEDIKVKYKKLADSFISAGDFYHQLVCNYCIIQVSLLSNEIDGRESLQVFTEDLLKRFNEKTIDYYKLTESKIDQKKDIEELAYYSHLLGQCYVSQAVLAIKNGSIGYDDACRYINAALEHFCNVQYFPYLTPYLIFALQFYALCLIYKHEFKQAEVYINIADSFLENFEKELYSNAYFSCKKLREDNIKIKEVLYRESGDKSRLKNITQEYERNKKCSVQAGFIMECQLETLLTTQFSDKSNVKYISNMTIPDPLLDYKEKLDIYIDKAAVTNLGILGGLGTGKTDHVHYLIRKLESKYLNKNLLNWSINSENEMSFLDSLNKLFLALQLVIPNVSYETIIEVYQKLLPELLVKLGSFDNVVIIFDNIKSAVLTRFLPLIKRFTVCDHSSFYIIYTGDVSLANYLPKNCSCVKTDQISYENALVILHKYSGLDSVESAGPLLKAIDRNLIKLMLAAKTIGSLPNLKNNANGLGIYWAELHKSYKNRRIINPDAKDVNNADLPNELSLFKEMVQYFLKAKAVFRKEYELLFYFLAFIGPEHIPLKLIKYFLSEIGISTEKSVSDEIASIKLSKLINNLEPIITRSIVMANCEDDLYSMNESIQQGLLNIFEERLTEPVETVFTGSLLTSFEEEEIMVDFKGSAELVPLNFPDEIVKQKLTYLSELIAILVKAIKSTSDRNYKDLLLIHADFFLDKLKKYNDQYPIILEASFPLIGYVGIKLFNLGEIVHAQHHLIDIVKVDFEKHNKNENFELLADAYITLANSYIRNENFHKAIPICQMLKHSSSINQYKQIMNLSVYASCLQMSGNVEEAITLLTDEKWKDVDFSKNMDTYFRLKDTLIACYHFKGDLNNTILLANEIIDKKKQFYSKDNIRVCNTLAFKAAAQYIKREFNEAKKTIDDMMNILEQKDTNIFSSHQWLISGVTLVESGDFIKGLANFRKIEELANKLERPYILIEARSSIIHTYFMQYGNNYLSFLIYRETHLLVNDVVKLLKLLNSQIHEKLIADFEIFQSKIKGLGIGILLDEFFTLIQRFKVLIYGSKHPYTQVEEIRVKKAQACLEKMKLVSPLPARNKEPKMGFNEKVKSESYSTSYSNLKIYFSEENIFDELIAAIESNRKNYQQALVQQKQELSKLKDSNLDLSDYKILDLYRKVNSTDADADLKKSLYQKTLLLVRLEREFFVLEKRLQDQIKMHNKVRTEKQQKEAYSYSTENKKYYFVETETIVERSDWSALYAAGFDEPESAIENLKKFVKNSTITNYIRQAIINNYCLSLTFDEPFAIEGVDKKGKSIAHNIDNFWRNCKLDTIPEVEENFMQYLEKPEVQLEYLNSLLKTGHADPYIVAACLCLQDKQMALMVNYNSADTDKCLVNYHPNLDLQDNKNVCIIFYPNAGFYSAHYNRLNFLKVEDLLPLKSEKQNLSPEPLQRDLSIQRQIVMPEGEDKSFNVNL